MTTITKDTLRHFANTEEGKQILNSVCNETKDLEIDLLEKAVEFVKNSENQAAGLAAPQVGSKVPWFVMKKRNGAIIIVYNPKIIGRMGNKQYIEGCFSETLPARVKRSKSITVDYTLCEVKDKTISMAHIKETLEGHDAQVFQHEYDHLKGKLICKIGEVIEL